MLRVYLALALLIVTGLVAIVLLAAKLATARRHVRADVNTAPKRRWFRFSLRTVLVVVTVLSVLLGWKVRQVERQKAAVALVKKSGGFVHYDYHIAANQKWVSDAEPPGPEWLRNLIGVDYFATVIAVQWGDFQKIFGMSSSGSNVRVTDLSPLSHLPNLSALYLLDTRAADISPLERLTELKMLMLFDSEVRDISSLRNLVRLQTLDLRCPHVSNLSPLETMAELEILCVDGKLVTDFSPVTRLGELKDLSLSGSHFTDASCLSNLVELTNLSLDSTKVSDVSPLADLRKLIRLSLQNTDVADLSPLAHMTNLEYLMLDHTPVEDLSPLADLRKLKVLRLTGVAVSDEEVSEIRKALPGCLVMRL